MRHHRVVMTAYAALMALVERNLVPDAVLRAGIRETCARSASCATRTSRMNSSANKRSSKIYDDETIAEATDAANEQHYEVPTAFYELCLGSRLKYSCCLYEDDEGEEV